MSVARLFSLRKDPPIAAWLCLALIVVSSSMQPVPVLPVPRMEAEFPEPFTTIRGLRELSDGRLIVNDYREQILKLLDMRSRTARQVGRKGSGPGEYQMVLNIIRLPGDSTAAYDMGRARFISVLGDGSTGVLPARLGGDSLHASITDDSRADSSGRIYSSHRRTPNDSLEIERFDRRTGKYDVVARVYSELVAPLPPSRVAGVLTGRGAPADSPAGRAAGGRIFATRDQWAVSLDGRVAVVSAYPYRVHFTEADGRRWSGAAIAVEPIRVADAHKAKWREMVSRPVPTMSVRQRVVSVGFAAHPVAEPAQWPEYLPPFPLAAVSFAPDGMLWVQRTAAANAPSTFDLIDRAGRLSARFVLPRNTRLVGFGVNSMYLVRVDNDDLEHLQKYSLPRRAQPENSPTRGLRHLGQGQVGVDGDRGDTPLTIAPLARDDQLL